MIIRLARLEEKSALEALQRRASLANPGDRAAILANPDAIELPQAQIQNQQVFIVETDGVIAGFSAVYRRQDGDIELDGLFVEPHLWRRGVGRLLIQAALDYAKAHNAQSLHVIGNPHAEAFYVSVGFVQYGVHETRFGRGLLMNIAAK
jgi:GNAT superfamily N-acetyltransferase